MNEEEVDKLRIYLGLKGYPVKYASNDELLNMLVDDEKNFEIIKRGRKHGS